MSMRSWGNGIVGKAVVALAAAAAVLLGQPLIANAAPGPLTITPLGWNVIGLDSNNVNVGPNRFPVGARVCNTGSDPVANLDVDWTWDSTNTYLTLVGGSSFVEASLAAGDCQDFYFNVQVTRNTSAFDTARRFHITAAGDSVATVSTPTPREIYVEHLVSQARNSVTNWTLANSVGCDPATGTVYVGATCTATIVSETATQGYEQLVNAYYFDNSIFRIESIATAYDKPTGQTNDQMYADGCGWDNNPTSGTYLECLDTDPISGGKVGGDPITTVISFTIIGTGTQDLTGIIYDFSGSSFHYNSDAGVPPDNVLSLTAEYEPTAPDAVDDSATTDEDTFVDIDVLANDSDLNANMDASSLSVDTQPANGTAAVVGGEIRYTPDPDFSGVDSFTYEICDSTAPTPCARRRTVTVTVNEVNDGPTAVDDSDSVDEDSSVTVDVLGNDSDPDDGLDPASVTVTSGPSNGSTTVNPDGSDRLHARPGLLRHRQLQLPGVRRRRRLRHRHGRHHRQRGQRRPHRS